MIFSNGGIIFKIIYSIASIFLILFAYLLLFRKNVINKLVISLQSIGVKDINSVKKINKDSKTIFFSIWNRINVIKLEDNADKVIALIRSGNNRLS